MAWLQGAFVSSRDSNSSLVKIFQNCLQSVLARSSGTVGQIETCLSVKHPLAPSCTASSQLPSSLSTHCKKSKSDEIEQFCQRGGYRIYRVAEIGLDSMEFSGSSVCLSIIQSLKHLRAWGAMIKSFKDHAFYPLKGQASSPLLWAIRKTCRENSLSVRLRAVKGLSPFCGNTLLKWNC